MDTREGSVGELLIGLRLRGVWSRRLCGADEDVKFARIADDPGVYVTTPHFDGYPAVLVRLATIGVAEPEELITNAWLSQAPKTLSRRFLNES
jgi:hypothetical protein